MNSDDNIQQTGFDLTYTTVTSMLTYKTPITIKINADILMK